MKKYLLIFSVIALASTSCLARVVIIRARLQNSQTIKFIHFPAKIFVLKTAKLCYISSVHQYSSLFNWKLGRRKFSMTYCKFPVRIFWLRHGVIISSTMLKPNQINCPLSPWGSDGALSVISFRRRLPTYAIRILKVLKQPHHSVTLTPPGHIKVIRTIIHPQIPIIRYSDYLTHVNQYIRYVKLSIIARLSQKLTHPPTVTLYIQAFKHGCAQIPLSGRTHNCHNHFALHFRPGCHLGRCPHIGSGTDARQNSLFRR